MCEEVLEKTGQDLFKEILRIYETAEFEDYFKAGKWKDDLMKTDYVLLSAHRKEAGAPDPPALEDVKLPEGISKTNVVGAVGLPTAANAAMGAGSASGAVAELRLIALFVAKWKLDPTKTKAAVAKLTPVRRRYVIQNFKGTQAGEAGVTELETFIQECEKNGSFSECDKKAGAVAIAPVAGTPVPVAAVSGLKRPLTVMAPASAVLEAQKKLRLVQGAPAPVAMSPATSALAAKLAAARAAQGSGIRPVGQTHPVGLVKPVGQYGVAQRPFGANPVAQPKGALIRNLLKKF
jgi:hypothetical protein